MEENAWMTRAINGETIRDIDVPEPDWLIPDLLERGSSLLLHSQPKAGKTALAVEIATAVSTGGTLFGQPVPQGRVLYLDYENRIISIKRHMERIGIHDPGSGYWHHPSPGLDLNRPAHAALLLNVVDDLDIDLLVIDTISKAVDGDEQAATTYAQLHKRFLHPLKEAGVATILLDHQGKDDSRGSRGSSAKAADVEQVWSLARKGNDLTLTRTHARNGDLGADAYRLQRGPNDGLLQPAISQATMDALDLLKVLDPEARFGRDRANRALIEKGHHVQQRTLQEALRLRRTGEIK